MRKFLAALVILTLVASYEASAVAATPIVALGKTCNKPGTIQSSGKKKLQCVTAGSKTAVWKTYIPVKSSPTLNTPTPRAVSPVATPSAPPAPTSFADLYANRLGISGAAWVKSQSVFKASTTMTPPIEIFTGPNTNPYETNAKASIDKVTKLMGGA